MPQEFREENPDLIVRGGELVMNLTAQSLRDEFLGRVCITDEDEGCLLNQRLARLTPGECEVAHLILEGKMNKEIAAELSLSIRAIEDRRARLMTKMDANSLVELVQMVMTH